MVTNGLIILAICMIVRFVKPMVRPYAERGLLGAITYMLLCLYYMGGVHVGVVLVAWGLLRGEYVR